MPSQPSNQTTASSKTFQAYLTHICIQERKLNISTPLCTSLTPAGTMQNGSVLAQDTLAHPSLENGYCWLESPSALSSTGKTRPPGLSKLETQLKKHGVISKGEVLNPAFLCKCFNLPPTYLDPSECRTAAQLLEDNAKQPEIFSTQPSGRSPSNESCTSKVLGSAERFPLPTSITLSTKTRKRRTKGNGSGYLYNKPYHRDNKTYSQWWYQYELNGIKKTKYIPKSVLGDIRVLEENKVPVKQILELLEK